MCHSSSVNRSAGSSCSSFCASVVFPEQGSPTIKWRVAILLTPKGHLEAAQRLALCPCGVLVGGTRQRHFTGTNFKPRKRLENAHAVPKDGSPTTIVSAYFAGGRVRSAG